MSIALEAVGLGATYRGLPALHDVSVAIAEGEALAVVGRSGSGKSTLARLLAGLVPRDATVTGRLRWPGGEADPARARAAGLGRRVAWLPQEAQAALHPMLRIGTQVAETLRAAEAPSGAGAVARSLAAVGLDPLLARRYPHEISGGQAQRAALACALAQAPSVLVADEPTSALDADTGEAVLALLAGLCRDRGMALVLVTHDPDAAARLCSRALVLENGRQPELRPTARTGSVLRATTPRLRLPAECCPAPA